MKAFQQKPRVQPRGNKAFSIVEMVVAMALIGLLVLAVYSAITSGMGTIRMARENLRATQLLLDKLEAIRLYHWGQVNSNFIPSTFIANYDVQNPSTTSGVLYYGRVVIEPSAVGTTYSDDMKKITVRLRWKTGQLNRAREMSTYVSSSGIQNYVY